MKKNSEDVMNSEAFTKWRDERDQALRTLDMGYARRMLPQASDDEVRLLAMHKARYDCTAIEPELRHASAAWLRAGNHTDMSGHPILPEGELP